MPSIGRGIHIPLNEFAFTFVRSSGPGGQNVNKVSSKAVLRWSVVASRSLPEGVRERFLKRYATRITAEGDLLLTSQKYRDRDHNMSDCLEKVMVMIASVAEPPTPRKPTKPSRAAKLRQVETKQATSQKKQRRRPPELED